MKTLELGCFLGESTKGNYKYGLEVDEEKISFNHPILGKLEIGSKPNLEGVAATASLVPVARNLVKKYSGCSDVLSFKYGMMCIDQEYILRKENSNKSMYRLVHSCDLTETGDARYIYSSLTIYDAFEKNLFNISAKSNREGFSHFSENSNEIADYASREFDKTFPIVKRKVAKFLAPKKLA